MKEAVKILLLRISVSALRIFHAVDVRPIPEIFSLRAAYVVDLLLAWDFDERLGLTGDFRSAGFRGRPPFLPASEAICRRRSAESFWARALPPMRANSVTVSGFFFMPAIYHAAGMQAADIHIAARAFSLIVAFQISTEEDGITAGGRSLCSRS
jgi:hypothetical protein